MANNTKDLSRIVKSIDILGAEISVEFKDELIHEDGTACLGMFSPGEHLIEILSGDEIPYESQLSTLLHECIECLDTKLELDMEHRNISSMEAGIFQLLRSNPDLCKAFSLYQPRKK